jgi:hydrogenase expression/formation protein HypC
MCVAIPARVVSLENDCALVEMGGSMLNISTILVEDLVPGDYVIVHAGFAIRKLDEHEARESLTLLRQLADSLAP